VSEGWSVRKTESYTGSKAAPAKKQSRKKRKKAKSAEIAAIEQQLTEKLGTKVLLNGNDKKGSLTLEYYSRDELEQLIEILMK
jgi:ParB family chromosome partitioning protein